MQLKDLSLPDPQANLDLDEELFRLCDKQGDGEYVRFWESPVHFVVLGRIGKEEEDVNSAAARAGGVVVLRRTSGGGTVLQGPGCLNYAFVLSKQKRPVLNDLRASYEWILAQVIAALRPLGIEAAFRPISDLALASNEKKFSGNAQRRGKTHILHHGTILYDFDLDLISKYLTLPKDMPDYRKARAHKDFVANISIRPDEFKASLASRFGLQKNYLK